MRCLVQLRFWQIFEGQGKPLERGAERGAPMVLFYVLLVLWVMAPSAIF